jgi:hypothetical protein
MSKTQEIREWVDDAELSGDFGGYVLNGKYVHEAIKFLLAEIDHLTTLAATHLADQELLVVQERKRVAKICHDIAWCAEYPASACAQIRAKYWVEEWKKYLIDAQCVMVAGKCPKGFICRHRDNGPQQTPILSDAVLVAGLVLYGGRNEPKTPHNAKIPRPFCPPSAIPPVAWTHGSYQEESGTGGTDWKAKIGTGGAMTDYELIEKMKVLKVDHAPDGWPAVRMEEISRLTALAAKGMELIDNIYHVTSSPNYDKTVSGNGYVILSPEHCRRLTAENERYKMLLLGIEKTLNRYGR